jgi:hypothetical protein
MFYSEAQQLEYEDDMAQDAMSQGEYMSAALSQYAGSYGAVDVTREWILSPFDTWHLNPHYTGPRGRHPEDDDYEDEIPAARVARRLEAVFEPRLLDAHFDEEIPF